jgi:hypothetical protein
MSGGDPKESAPPKSVEFEPEPEILNWSLRQYEGDPDQPIPHVRADAFAVYDNKTLVFEYKTLVRTGFIKQGEDRRTYTIKITDHHGKRGYRLARAPAGRLISALQRILTPTAFKGMIAPYIAQEQHEYYDALCRKEYRQARWIAVRMHLLVWYNVLSAVASSITRLVRLAR